MATKKAPAPAGLGERGTVLWAVYTEKYEFRPDELLWLETACRATDRLGVMDAELSALGYMLTGSTGQDVVNPLVAEIRATEAHRDNALKRLGIPDEGGSVVEVNQNRSAGQSRWAVAHGKGA